MTTEFDNQDVEDAPEQTEQSAQERNFQALRRKLEAVESELQRLRPLEMEKQIREAGFDPDSGEGKAIGLKLSTMGDDAPKEASAIQELVAEEFGWKPQTGLTEAESQRQQAQSRVESLRTESEPDQPLSLGDEIATAEAEGRWEDAARLKLQRFVTDAT
ncbi:MAG: hypothetical protein ACE5F5_12465 [Acidimicrobiia bacterium]